MTKKLEEEFNLPPIEEVTKTEPTIVETEAEIEETQNALRPTGSRVNLVSPLKNSNSRLTDIIKA